MDDLIKRDDAINAITEFLNKVSGDDKGTDKANRFLAEMILNNIPAAQPVYFGYITSGGEHE